MSQKNPEHIIDYILKKTENNNYYYKSSKPLVYKKSVINKNIFYCEKCQNVWSKVPSWVDNRVFRTFPKNNIPTYGKKRKKCVICKKKEL